MSRFRTIEISDPQFESGNLRFITVKSPCLKGRGDICVYVPPQARAHQVLPVVILLHGVYGSAWAWTHSAGVHLQANEMIYRGELPPMILAMPSDGLWGDGSGYLPHSGYDFEKWIVEDIVAALSEKIVGASQVSPVFIAGLSMGGFGALRIGAKYGKRFQGISGHSSITSLEQLKLFVEEDLSHYQQADARDEDIFQTIQNAPNSLPPLRFDCGQADHLLSYNRLLHQQLKSAGIAHEYEEFPGGHEWSYWTEHIGKSLLFFARQLRS
jgi:enterochelin esterase-like enzyme